MAVDLSQWLGGKTGTWSPFGITLPDYGNTESLVNQGNLPNTSTWNNQSVSSNSLVSPLPSSGPSSIDTPNPIQSGGTTGSGILSASKPTGGNPTGGNPMEGMEESARSQAQIELEQAMAENEYVQSTLNQQSGQLDTQLTRSLSSLETDRSRANTEHMTAEKEATSATETAKNKALSTAQDIQKKNRNVLRALGILSSSAGGEMLTKPMTEYGSQAAELQQGLVDRLGKVEQWWIDRSHDFDVAKQDVQQKYADLKEKIANDLRFNAQQRGIAIKAGTVALNARLKEIEAQKIQYQTAAKQYSDNILLKIAEMKMYQNPTADVSAIYNTLLSSAQGVQQPQQVGIQQTEEQRKRLLSGY